MITVSAPGKIHLLGEHAVIYGKPAILAAINRRITVSVKEGTDNTSGYVADILRIVRNHFHTDKKLFVRIRSDIPQGYHLGSSAAVAVSVTAAASYCLKQIWNPVLFNQLAFEAEKLKHGNPSGGDNTAVTMGGFIWFRKELDFLTSIWQLPFKTKLSSFFLLDTGKPEETTKEMVAAVRLSFTAHRSRFMMLFHENEEQTRRIAVALKTNDEPLLIDSMRKGQRTLESMGVVSRHAASVIRSVETKGGAAKILGGGGKKKGVGYVLCHSRTPPSGAIPVTLGEEGVRLEERI